MSTSPIPQTIEILSREKGIDQQVIISAIEDAVVTAARKQFKTGEDLHARYNPETGDVELYAVMRVVETVENSATEIDIVEVESLGIEGAEVGDQLEFPKSREELGRIAAQTAKQIIFQKVREAERNNVYEEYINRVGELVHGFVKRFEGGRIIVDLGKVEAVLPKMEQSRAEAFSQGERIRVVINSVSKDAKGPQVEVSRTSPELIKRLFEMEVPEIYDGTVQIKGVVREPGDRAKIAVISTERDVDPVGACVGMKGSRVQAIIRELRGERIDIIEWSEDPAVFAANALSPAKVSKVEINSFEEKRLTITVPEDQLSLAIGKKGQNVRLAAKLVGWHIDIRSAEEAARAAAAQLEAVMAGSEATLTNIRESLALDQITAERLRDRGIETIEQLASTTVDELVDLIDISLDEANSILEKSRRLLAQKQAREARAQREADKEAAEAGAEAAAAGTEAIVTGTEVATEAVEAGAEAAETVGEAAEPGEAVQAGAVEGHIEPAAEAAAETITEETIVQHAASIEPALDAAQPEAQAEESALGEPGQPEQEGSSVTELQLDEASADSSPAHEPEPHEEDGPMPIAGLEAQAPGAAVVRETHAEWLEHVEQTNSETADESETGGEGD